MKVLFTGTSGVDLKGAVDNLATFARESEEYNRPVHEVLKAENYFLDEVERTGLLPSFGHIKPRSKQMIYALGLPRLVVRRSWGKAVGRLFEEKPPSCDSDVFLCAHMTFHLQRTREFFSPVDRAALLEVYRPEVVVTLIDDTEACFARLRRKGQMFSEAAYSYSGMEGINNAMSHMRLLFDWRAIEIVEADSFAAEMDVPHYCLSVKHPVGTAAKLLYRPDVPKLYVSHPISKPRKDLEKGDQDAFTAFQQPFEALCKMIRGPATLIEPTAIDEFRFRNVRVTEVQEDDTPKESVLWLPRHTARWPPLPEPMCGEEEAPGQEAYLDPGGHFDDDLLDRFACAKKEGRGLQPTEKVVQLEIAANLMGVLVGDITAQINARDHKLVEQCDGLVVYRPLYRGSISGGVYEEIRYHCQLCVAGMPRRGGLWIYTHREDEALWLRNMIRTRLCDDAKPGGILTGPGISHAQKQCRIMQLVDSLAMSEDRAVIAQEISRKLTDCGIRRIGGASPGALSPRPELGDVEASVRFTDWLQSLQPDYVDVVESHKTLSGRDIHCEVFVAPEFSMEKFVQALVEFCAGKN